MTDEIQPKPFAITRPCDYFEHSRRISIMVSEGLHDGAKWKPEAHSRYAELETQDLSRPALNPEQMQTFSSRGDAGIPLEQIEHDWPYGNLSSFREAINEAFHIGRAESALAHRETNGEGRRLLEMASHVLRSYQYGNAATELAEEAAGAIDRFLQTGKPETLEGKAVADREAPTDVQKIYREQLGTCRSICGKPGHEGHQKPHILNVACWDWRSVADREPCGAEFRESTGNIVNCEKTGEHIEHYAKTPCGSVRWPVAGAV